jgi:hypothetical protein
VPADENVFFERLLQLTILVIGHVTVAVPVSISVQLFVMIGLMVRHKSVCFHKVWQIDFGVIHSMFDDLAETPTSYPSFFILARRFASIYIFFSK